ncbi:MAG: hypothetical protein GY909_18960 [Oligoflexia bacterium]|nr:hypothetical protein [Oligoflexia bacterium]
MKRFVLFMLICLTSFTLQAGSGKVSGTVELIGQKEKTKTIQGALFVILRNMGQTKGAPVAVVKIDNPTFPTKFNVTEKNIMIRGKSFTGPFWISAKFVPDANPLGEGQYYGVLQPETGIAIGSSKVKVKLKGKKTED